MYGCLHIRLKLLIKCQSYNINHRKINSQQIFNLTKQFKFFKNTIRKSSNKKVAGKPSSIATPHPSLLTKGFQYATLLETLGWRRFYAPKTNEWILIREVVGMYKHPYPLENLDLSNNINKHFFRCWKEMQFYDKQVESTWCVHPASTFWTLHHVEKIPQSSLLTSSY